MPRMPPLSTAGGLNSIRNWGIGGRGSYALTVTVTYSDTFSVAGRCHCNQLDLYLCARQTRFYFWHDPSSLIWGAPSGKRPNI